MTPDDAWHEVEWCSDLLCRYTVKIRSWGCGTLMGCDAGEQCDTLDHMADLRRRIDEARLLVGV